MGLTIGNFKDAISKGAWLSVDVNKANGQKAPEIEGKSTKDDIDVSDLKQASGDDMNKAANNIYLRGQLLTGIRDSLVANKLMTVTRQGNQENVSFAGRSADQVKTFFEKAEKELFGELTDGKYGVATASQDLASATVKDLLDRLNDLVAPVKPGLSTVSIKSAGDETYDWTFFNIPENKLTTAQKELRANCPDATDKQREALINPDSKSLALCLGLKEKDAKALKVDSVKERSENGFLECELVGSKGRKYGVLVNRKGELLNKDDFDACAKLFQSSSRLLDTVSPQDLKSVRLLADQFFKGCDTLFVMDEWIDALENGATLTEWSSAMIIGALPKARALQPQGEIKMATWWAALRLDEIEQMPPSKNIQSNEVLARAMTLRVRNDFASMVGCKISDFSVMENLNGDDVNEPLHKVKNQYRLFLHSLSGGFRYTNALLNLKHHFIQGKEAYVKRHVPVITQKPNTKNVPAASIPAKLLEAAKTELVATRAKGSVFRFGQHSFTNVKTGKDTVAQTNLTKQDDDFCACLQESGFTPKQIMVMSKIPNDMGIALLRDMNFAQGAYNMDVQIEKDGDKMRVAYLFNCYDPLVDEHELADLKRTPQRMRYEVVISPSGYAETVDFGLVEADQNHDENINNINNINNPPEDEGEEEINTSHQSKAMRPASNDRIAPHFTDEQLNAIVYPNRKELASFLNVSIQEAKTAVFDDIRQAVDGKSIMCKVRRPDKPDAEVVISGDGKIFDKQKFNEAYNGLLDQLKLIDNGQAELLIAAFKPDEWSAAKHILELCGTGSRQYENNYELGCLQSINVKQCTVSMLVDVLGKVVRKNPGRKPQEMLPALWKELGLQGRAPASTDKDQGLKFFKALRNKCFADLTSIYGWQRNEDIRILVCPSPNETEDDVVRIAQKYGSKKESYTQTVEAFTNITLLSYSAKVRAFKGELKPTLKDCAFDPSPMVKIPQSPTLVKNAANSLVGLRNRYNGASFRLGKENAFTMSKDLSAEGCETVLKKLLDDGYDEKQIYQFAASLNNSCMALQSAVGGAALGKGAILEVLPNGSMKGMPKDLHVRVRMPIARFAGIQSVMNETTNQTKEVPALNVTNEFVVQEFSIHPDGSATTTDVKVIADTSLPASTIIEQP